jgi:uncharacterized damage-inducible protein DinB
VTSTDPRPDPPRVGELREQLNGFLDFLRATVVWKATGLTDEQARRQLVPSELTTVAGLLAHLTWVEQYWFGVVLDGRPDLWRERFAQDPDAEFRPALTTPLDRLIADYEAECARSREVAARLDLAATGTTSKGQPVNLRWVLIHMIEETGRHAGHLDLLRELLDGSTGE